MRLFVNGNRVGAFEGGRTWTDYAVVVPQDVLTGSANQLEIRWPWPDGEESAVRERLAGNLEDGVWDQPRPAFGQITRLSARIAGR